jgi:hypothetical protein
MQAYVFTVLCLIKHRNRSTFNMENWPLKTTTVIWPVTKDTVIRYKKVCNESENYEEFNALRSDVHNEQILP